MGVPISKRNRQKTVVSGGKQPSRPIVLGVLASILGGCAADITPSPRSAVAPLPEIALADGPALWPREEWWKDYGSAELDAFVAEALQSNTDIQTALARVEQARGRARSAGALLFPAIGLEGSATRSDSNRSPASERFGLDLVASYEADLWGRYRADRDAARFSLLASRFDHQASRLIVISDVVLNYAALMTIRERQAIGRLNLSAAQRLLARVEAMDRVGMALVGDLASQRALVAGAKGDLALLDQAEAELRAALALLLGRPAQDFTVSGLGIDALASLPRVSPGLSSELLLRRPDIAAAEAGLAAASADLRSARAAMLPRITLTASGGVEGGTSPSAALYNLLAGLTQPLIDHGRLAGARDTAEGLRLEREAAYRGSILVALSEVERDLKAIASLDRAVAELATQVAEAVKALDAAEARHRVGVEEIIVSLDAQRTLYAARDRLAQIKGSRLAWTISLQRTLGGGWSREGTDLSSILRPAGENTMR